MGWLERNFRAGKRKAPRPFISDPFNFQHTGSGAVNAFMTSAPDLPRSAPPFRPLQLSIYEQDNQISPLLPHFTDADDALTHPERALTRNSGRDTFDEDATTLAHSRSYSSLSFHIPRRPLNEASSFTTATASNFGDSPPRIPPRARTRPRAYTSPSVEAIVERIASAIIERDIILEEIESVKERQSISLSRPGSAYGQFPHDTEPMPAIPAMPPSAPSFAERVSIERPRTAPSTQSTFNKAYPPPPQPFTNRSQSFDAPGASQHPTSATPVRKPVPASAFNSHPPWRSPQIIDNSLDIEVPLAPPLPLVLRPPLRKKKSFSRVSSWLFPAGVEDREQPAPQRQHRRDVSLDSVTNAPIPLTDRDGFYQILPPSAVFSGRRSSFDSMSDITRSGTHSVYSTDEDPFIGPGTATATSNWSPGSTPPEIARRKDSATSRVREAQEVLSFWSQRHRTVLKVTMAAMSLVILAYLATATARVVRTINDSSCDTVATGYQCSPEISQYWGPYSPYFSVPSEIDNSVPEQCTVNFVQILSRHGAREPTAGKGKAYNSTIQRIQSSVTSYGSGYEFIKDYVYALGTDQLTTFGQQELVNSGVKFYERYGALAQAETPFVRASGQERVIESAQNWTQGLHQALLADKAASSGSEAYPYPILVISEADGSNNTLNHGLCTAFEDGPDSKLGDDAEDKWTDVFLGPITARLNENLPGANLTAKETVSMMDMCPFNTVANAQGQISDFCGLFTADEWQSYGYLQSLGKWYKYGNGNPLGPTQGVGFTNELIARLTGSRVVDETSTNHTLDDNPATFPLNRTLYADFSHDNTMTSIFSAMGLYNATVPLSNTTRETAAEEGGYSASWTVPFSARIYVEKMTCSGEGEELVRVLVNDRVVPLVNCGADDLGRCALGKFVDSLSFAKDGGDWSSCFV
ncbi:3-phytase A [Cytospora mali]|uniref:Phytase A n=1 Tax=Cytospora mali TaxID=578113 RepID=A0A194V0L2_CYTMA|nr:3-phytase A [Valsa mali var. pyri (nom. inval.)]